MQPARVLVVEDERVVAMHLRQQLSRLGYVVPAMATKGAEALSKIAELLPDIVLMDIHIEGDIDGIETAARIPPELQIPGHLPDSLFRGGDPGASPAHASLRLSTQTLFRARASRRHPDGARTPARRFGPSQGFRAARGTRARAHQGAHERASTARSGDCRARQCRTGPAAITEDGGRGPAHWRHCPRFQQSAAGGNWKSERGDPRRAGRSCRRPAPAADAKGTQRGTDRGHFDTAIAVIRAQAAPLPQTRQCEWPDRRNGRHVASLARRDNRD